MRTCVAVLFLALVGCSSPQKSSGERDPSGLGHAQGFGRAESLGDEASPSEAELGPVTKGSFREHPAKQAWIVEGEAQPRAIDLGLAEQRGYTIVDLGNEWVPFIFSEKTPGQDDAHVNRYRATYLGLANDRIDSYGDKLAAWDRNYLELYGIPPTLSVVRAEWQRIEDSVVACLEKEGFDPEVFRRYQGTIAYKGGAEKQRHRTAARLATQLRKTMRKQRLDFDAPDDLLAAASNPRTKALYQRWRGVKDEIDVIDHAQRRFRCEGLFEQAQGGGRYEPGVFDSATTHALANFERKHDIMGWGHFKADNLALLATSPEEAVHGRLLRVVEERVVSSAGILEDGSAAKWQPNFSYTDGSGTKHTLRNVVGEFTTAAITALGLETPASARAALDRLAALGDGDYEHLLVAIRMPERPPYYASDMRLEVLIDRGDVWYDFPFDAEGKPLAQPRRRYPHLTLYVNYDDQKIPLVHWRTTIGAWRNELNDAGEIMYKYKNSDVGPRVWKDVMAAPVWIPPVSTPPSELIKARWRNGKFSRDVNYDEIGPGYRSAYGLVAAYHIRQTKDENGAVVSEFDNSIRTHGSVDYMSILRRFSHGCHRLYNMDAVRLFSFVLLHRDYERMGQQPVGVSRDIAHEDATYRMRIDTRGYKYELREPIPVLVTEGRIKGRRKTPILEYVPKPLKPEDTMIEIDDGSGGIQVLEPPPATLSSEAAPE